MIVLHIPDSVPVKLLIKGLAYMGLAIDTVEDKDGDTHMTTTILENRDGS